MVEKAANDVAKRLNMRRAPDEPLDVAAVEYQSVKKSAKYEGVFSSLSENPEQNRRLSPLVHNTEARPRISWLALRPTVSPYFSSFMYGLHKWAACMVAGLGLWSTQGDSKLAIANVHDDNADIAQMCEKKNVLESSVLMLFTSVNTCAGTCQPEFLAVSTLEPLLKSLDCMAADWLSNLGVNGRLVMQIAAQHFTEAVIEQLKTHEGLYFYLSAVANPLLDREVLLIYIDVVTRERWSTESNLQEPRVLMSFSKEHTFEPQLPMAMRTISQQRMKFIEQFLQRDEVFGPSHILEVCETLIGQNVIDEEAFITHFILAGARNMILADSLMAVMQSFGKFITWVEARATEGSTDALDIENLEHRIRGKPWAQGDVKDSLAPAAVVAGEKFDLTTAINYTNGPPHMGHAYEAISSDILCRYHRWYGRKVFFLTGTDELGQKVTKPPVITEKPPVLSILVIYSCEDCGSFPDRRHRSRGREGGRAATPRAADRHLQQVRRNVPGSQ